MDIGVTIITISGGGHISDRLGAAINGFGSSSIPVAVTIAEVLIQVRTRTDTGVGIVAVRA
jgi:hypothetical protein